MLKTIAFVALTVVAGFVFANDHTVSGVILSAVAAVVGLSALACGEPKELRSNAEVAGWMKR